MRQLTVLLLASLLLVPSANSGDKKDKDWPEETTIGTLKVSISRVIIQRILYDARTGEITGDGGPGLKKYIGEDLLQLRVSAKNTSDTKVAKFPAFSKP